MKRRDFLRAAGGGAAAATATGTAAAQEDGGGGGGGGGGSATVTVGPGGNLTFEPGTSEPLRIAPGTTVTFEWDSDNHNIVVESQPSDANWGGTEGGKDVTYDTGHTHEHTFEVLGTYEYHCQPHKTAGMVGTIEVVENPNAGGGGRKELDELGVPIQAHYVGGATILGIIVSIVYTFYILKYGESPNTGRGK